VNSRVRFTAHLTPKGGSDAVMAWQKGSSGTSVLKARVSAPAQANDALIRLLAKKVRVAVARVQIISGATSRMKLIEVHGVSALPAGFGVDD
jgi:uncharacterized protein